jgi:hypothetical protein
MSLRVFALLIFFTSIAHAEYFEKGRVLQLRIVYSEVNNHDWNKVQIQSDVEVNWSLLNAPNYRKKRNDVHIHGDGNPGKFENQGAFDLWASGNELFAAFIAANWCDQGNRLADKPTAVKIGTIGEQGVVTLVPGLTLGSYLKFRTQKYSGYLFWREVASEHFFEASNISGLTHKRIGEDCSKDNTQYYNNGSLMQKFEIPNYLK